MQPVFEEFASTVKTCQVKRTFVGAKQEGLNILSRRPVQVVGIYICAEGEHR
jgi:hypothetical protein